MAAKKQWLTMDQAIEKTGLSRNTLHKAIQANEMDSEVRPVEGSRMKLRYVEEESLREWFASREAKGHYSHAGDGKLTYTVRLSVDELTELTKMGYELRRKNKGKATTSDEPDEVEE